MIRLSIIGSGNVAQHLIRAFGKSAEIELVQVFSRNKKSVASLVSNEKIISDFHQIQPVDLIIIAVSDNAIAEVSEQIPVIHKLVVHTSGTSSIDILDNQNRKGVFYPLQTFSKSKEIDFLSVPICLEAKSETDFKLLETVAKSISKSVYRINSEQRKALHVAAVFACNFVNHLYSIGKDICEENGMPFDILKPLILETADKIMELSPNEAQTGPAARNDSQTIEKHLAFLSDQNQKHIYKILTQSIITANAKKL